MKIEQLIVQYLLKSKKMTLQDIGTFTLSADIALPAEGDKDFVMPEDALKFEFNKKAPQDDDLIDFIVAQTRKIKPLATSDLESYSILAKQFLNIGKPFPIEGLGVLQKEQTGEYQFKQGIEINSKLDAAPGLLKEKAEGEISFARAPKEVLMGKPMKLVILSVIVLVIAATIYYFVQRNNKDQSVEKAVQATTDSVPPKKDTVVKAVAVIPDTIARTVPAPAPADSQGFRVVIREYTDRARAEKINARFASFGYKLNVVTTDSSHFKLAMHFNRPMNESSKIKDSLKILFGGTPYIEK